MDVNGAVLPSCVKGQLHGFTPVRRSEQSINLETPIHNTTVPWTTARCKRLLRPISSRLTLLKKRKPSHTDNGSAASSSKQDQTTHHSTVSNFVRNRQWTTSSAGLDRTDPEWEPEEAPRKKLKRTYSSKSGSLNLKGKIVHESHLGIQGASVQLPSPLVGRCLSTGSGRETDTTDEVSFSTTRASLHHVVLPRTSNGGYPWTSKSNPRDKFRRLAKSVAPLQWMIYDGLYSALHTLLAGTAKTRLRSETDAPSLFSMCLRKLPSYIAQEQALADGEDPDEPEDVVSFMYNELEGYSTARSPMSEVVRAHGILLFCESIEEGFIVPSIARNLVILCLQNSAYAEAERLISSMLKSLRSVSRPRNASDQLFAQTTSPALQALRDLSLQSGRYTFLFRQLSTLFAQGILPVGWTASQDMVDVWNRALRAITQNQDDALEAMNLIRAATSRLYLFDASNISDLVHQERKRHQCLISEPAKASEGGVGLSTAEDEKIENALIGTFTNICTILLSTVYTNVVPSDLRHQRTVDAMASSLSLRCLAIDSLQAIYFRNNRPPTDTAPSPLSSLVHIPYLSIRLCLPEEATRGKGAQQTSSCFLSPSSATSAKNLLDVSSTFLCSIAQCCSRITLSTPFMIMKHIITNLQNISLRSPDLMFLSQLAVSAAFEFAEITMRQEHLDWALRVEEACTDGVVEPGKAADRIPNGFSKAENRPALSFRWEDSICEWVACTPAPTKARAKARAAKIVSRPATGGDPQEDGQSKESESRPEIDEAETVSAEFQEDTPLPVPFRTMLSELSPITVISPPPCTARSTIITEDCVQSTPAARRPRPRFRFRPRRSDRSSFSGATLISSGSDKEDHHDDSSALERSADSPSKRARIEVRVPISLSRARSRPERERAELKDITNHPPPVPGSGPADKPLLKRGRKNIDSEAERQRNVEVSSNSSSSSRLLRVPREPSKPIRPRAGTKRWNLRQPGSSAMTEKGADESDDELDF